MDLAMLRYWFMQQYFTWYIIITEFRILYRFVPKFWQQYFSRPFKIGESRQTGCGHSSYNNSECLLPLLVPLQTNTQPASCHLDTLEACSTTCKVFCSTRLCSCACNSAVYSRSGKKAFFLNVNYWFPSGNVPLWQSFDYPRLWNLSNLVFQIL